MRKWILILGVIAVSSLSAQEINYGVGFEFHTWPSSLLTAMSGGYEGSSGMGILVPIDVMGFRVEPEISRSAMSSEYKSKEGSYSESEFSSMTTITLGLYKSFERGKNTLYAGGRVGKTWMKYEYKEGNNKDKDDDDYFIFAPTVGAEYKFSPNFSFGGEAMYYILSSNTDEESYESSNSFSQVIPRFLLRWYF